MFQFAERIAPMGNADAASCADYTVAMLSDLTRMVTMQNLFHDGGFSNQRDFSVDLKLSGMMQCKLNQLIDIRCGFL